MPRVLGIDPALAHLGLADVELLSDTEIVHALIRVHTEKSDKKRKVRASDDNLRRIVELHNAVAAHIYPDTIAVCAESQSWPRNAGSSAKVGMAWGVIGSIAAHHKLPILQVSPQELKRRVTGKKGASKEEVRAVLKQRYTLPQWPSTKKGREDAGDALGAVVACLDAEVIQMARRLLGQR